MKKYFFPAQSLICDVQKKTKQTKHTAPNCNIVWHLQWSYFSVQLPMFKSTYFLHSIKYSETYFFIEFGHKKIKFSTFYSNNFEQCANCIFLPCCVCMFFCSFISAIQTEPMILCLPILFSTFQLLRVMGKCILHVSLQIFQFRWSKIQIFYSRAPLRPCCIDPSTIYDLSVLH